MEFTYRHDLAFEMLSVTEKVRKRERERERERERKKKKER